jgi:hypothetical protein
LGSAAYRADERGKVVGDAGSAQLGPVR